MVKCSCRTAVATPTRMATNVSSLKKFMSSGSPMKYMKICLPPIEIFRYTVCIIGIGAQNITIVVGSTEVNLLLELKELVWYMLI